MSSMSMNSAIEDVVRGELHLVPLGRKQDWYQVDITLPSLPACVLVHGSRRADLPSDGERQEVTLHGASFLLLPGEVVTVQIGPRFGVYTLVDGKMRQLALFRCARFSPVYSSFAHILPRRASVRYTSTVVETCIDVDVCLVSIKEEKGVRKNA